VTGVELAVQAVLSAPSFTYRGEIGAADASGAARLTAHEIASELSFMLTDAPPDDELHAAAESGALSSPDEIASQVERMLGLPAVQRHELHALADLDEVRGAPAAHDRAARSRPAFGRLGGRRPRARLGADADGRTHDPALSGQRRRLGGPNTGLIGNQLYRTGCGRRSTNDLWMACAGAFGLPDFVLGDNDQHTTAIPGLFA